MQCKLRKRVLLSKEHKRLLDPRSYIEDDDEDYAFVVRKANKMMRRKFYKKKGLCKPNFKQKETSLLCM